MVTMYEDMHNVEWRAWPFHDAGNKAPGEPLCAKERRHAGSVQLRASGLAESSQVYR